MKLAALLREKLVDPILKAQGSPESIARGGSIGVWLAFTPTMGIQMFLACAIAVPLRANVPVAVAMVWVTNPIILVPIYFAFYWVGSLLLGSNPEGYRAMAGILRDSLHLTLNEGFLAGLEFLGRQILFPMVVGSFLIATSLAVPSYYGLLWFCRRRLERRLLAGLEQGKLEIVEGGIDKRSPEDQGSGGFKLPQPRSPSEEPAP